MLHPTLVSGLAISALVNLTAVAFSFPAGVGIATANSAGQVQQERTTSTKRRVFKPPRLCYRCGPFAKFQPKLRFFLALTTTFSMPVFSSDVGKGSIFVTDNLQKNKHEYNGKSTRTGVFNLWMPKPNQQLF
jgi:hypothetical protein